MSGTLFGVGLGPGDPGLVTRRAARLIADADVVAYPSLAGAPSFARAIAAELIAPGTREIVVDVPMTAAAGPARAAYDRGAAEIAAALDGGADVACLCEGDPFLYGSFMYLHARLADRYRVEVVPGVTSVTACAARAGLPLAARDGRLEILPALLPEEEIEARIAAAGSVAVVKVGRHLAKVRRAVGRLGRLGEAVYVERATLPGERVCPLGEAPDPAPYFSMVLLPGRGGPCR